jgi:adenylosuccinate synthase
MDGGAGSSGKGKISSFIGEHADNWQFCCNAFMSNAAHWVVLDDGRKYLYQALNSVAYLKKYQKMYVCGGAVQELDPILREIKENEVEPHRLGIHPLVAFVQQKDIDYEAGRCDFEGNYFEGTQHSDAMKLGSTLHGVGAARARRILRRKDVLLARDIPELQPYLCWTNEEITRRLQDGQAGLMEIAQGYQLGYLTRFYPKTTSRNCTVAAGLDDCQIAPKYAGNVIINMRTYPIRVNSNKYVHPDTGKLINDIEIKALRAEGREPVIYKGDSGGGYPDQTETTWDAVTADSGIKEVNPSAEIREITSLTKLERRVFTFSRQNLNDAIRDNATNGNTYISLNFVNYVDAKLEGARGGREKLTQKLCRWLNGNIQLQDGNEAKLAFLGTGAKTDDMIVLD